MRDIIIIIIIIIIIGKKLKSDQWFSTKISFTTITLKVCK